MKRPSAYGAAALLVALAVMWVLKGDLILAAVLAATGVALAGAWWFATRRRQ